MKSDSSKRNATVPIPSTIEKVRGFNTLTIYKMEASKFYYVRYYEDGKITRRSTKAEERRDALKFAEEFFVELKSKKLNNLPLTKKSGFIACAWGLLKENEARVARKEIAARKIRDDQLRLNGDIVPFFKKYEAHEVDYKVINEYLTQLNTDDRKLSVSSLKVQLSHIKTILRYAQRMNIISTLPAYPSLKTVDTPRSWFSTVEYNKLHNTAYANIGKVKKVFSFDEKTQTQKALRNIELTQELYDMILFMANTPIRPTDLRVLKHKHVAIVREPHQFLRLTHPPTKNHSSPVVSMPKTIEVYERIKARHIAANEAHEARKEKHEDIDEIHLFQPESPLNRDYALQQLHRQFDYLLEISGLKKDNNGHSRTLYSLRHIAIMFRLINGRGINLLSLARNARTSVEMIDRFYAKHLTAEMNVIDLQSQTNEKLEEVTNEARQQVRANGKEDSDKSNIEQPS